MTRVKFSLTALALGAAGMAAAAVPNPAIPSTTFATASQKAPKKGAPPKIGYYKNSDITKTTSVTVRTPKVTTVTTTVPKLDRNGKQIVIKGVPQFTTKVTTTTTYTSVTTKSTKITPKAQLYSTSGTGSVFATPLVNFSYLVPLAPHYLGALNGVQNARFSLSAVSTFAVETNGLNLSQIFDSGTISFARATPAHAVRGTFTGPDQSNLLSISFANAVLTTRAGSSTFTLSASTPTSTVVFSSDFLNFTNSANNGFSLAFNAASPVLSIAPTDPTSTNVTGGHSFVTTRANFSGQFSASSVPEPAAWSLLIAGFAMIGLRRRRPMATVVTV